VATDKQRAYYHSKGYHDERAPATFDPDLNRAYQQGVVHRKAMRREKTSFLDLGDLFVSRPLTVIDVAASHGIPFLLKLCLGIFRVLFRLVSWLSLRLVWAGVWLVKKIAVGMKFVFVSFPIFLWNKGRVGRIILFSLIGAILLLGLISMLVG
jgi:hypothetical protein